MSSDFCPSGMLTAAIREGEVNKTYIAIAVGELPLGTGVQTIDCGIRRQAESVIMRTTCPDSTAPDEVSVTDYEVLDTRDGLSLVRVRPRTGRTHQIRVHFAYIGHPLLGDDLYGTPDERIGRHALHAQSLELPLPFADRRICLQAPMAEDMLLLIKQYFPRYS